SLSADRAAAIREMCHKLILLSSIMVLEGVIEANSEPYTIEVLSAMYGDGLGHSCRPDISICNGRAECDFLVGDNLCALGPDAAASGRNLEVFRAELLFQTKR